LFFRIWNDLVRIDCIPALDEDLALAHSKSHIEKIQETIYSDKTNKGKQVEMEKFMNTTRFKEDTYENMHTAKSAYLSAGGTVEAIKAVCSDKANSKYG
jgi:acetoin utilization deacetylase AcuC-like enzyme